MADISHGSSEAGPHAVTPAASESDTRPSYAKTWSAGLAFLAFSLSLVFGPSINLTSLFLNRQDRWLLLADAVLLALPWVGRDGRSKPLTAHVRLIVLLVALLTLTCLVGHHWILAGYDMSRDEQIANFDAAVLASGHLVQKIPALWRDHADALNTVFMHPVVHRGAWISSYLPGNAALRALAGIIVSPNLTGPLLTMIGAIALWGCVRRIWPEDREAPIIALLLYAGSGQVLVTGMTAYAMPAHLAFNLIWLWLFLRRNWWADVAALIVGFGAVGLHQPLLHPMFAAPLLFLLLLERQWARAAFYALGYAAICAFWLWWPGWIWSLVLAEPAVQQSVGVDYFTRLKTIVLDGDPLGMFDMAANLLRFVAWQHLLLIPLMALSWKAARRDRLAGALAAGVLITILVMAVILPYQGHGFGYRYLHGLIGNCILLGLYGWKALEGRQAEWRPLLVRASIAGGIVILPLQLWMAHAFYSPAADVDKRIAAIDADYVIIGEKDAPFAIDLVHNTPALDKPPLRLIAEKVDKDIVATLCRTRPRIALLGDRSFDTMNAYYGLAPRDVAARRNHVLAPRLEAAGCRVSVTS